MFDIILFYAAFAVLGLGVLKNKKLGVAISFVAFLLAAMDFLCLKVMGQHIDYTTLTRIDGTMLAMAPQVTPTYFYGGVAAVVLSVAFHILVYKRMTKSDEAALENTSASSDQQASRNKMLSYGLLAFVVACLCFSETAASPTRKPFNPAWSIKAAANPPIGLILST